MIIFYFLFFFCSILIEFLIFYLFLFKDFRFSLIELLGIILAINLFTQFIFIFFLPLLELNFIYYLVISEIIIIIGEGYILNQIIYNIRIKKAIFISFCANIASWQLTPFLVYILLYILQWK